MGEREFYVLKRKLFKLDQEMDPSEWTILNFRRY